MTPGLRFLAAIDVSTMAIVQSPSSLSTTEMGRLKFDSHVLGVSILGSPGTTAMYPMQIANI
jgi:hypothetical protein